VATQPEHRSTLQQEARALGDPTRHAIFRTLAAADRPLDVGDLTERFDLNHNAIRQHLAKLVAAGLVTESRAAAAGPGRPRNVYAVDAAAAGRWDDTGPYEELSRLLAEIITSGDSAEEVGRRSGSRLAAAVAAAAGDPLDTLVAAMARQGFDPEVVQSRAGDRGPEQAEIVLHRCPFATTADEARDTVCSLHLGLAEGLVGGSGLQVRELIAREPASADCRVRLAAGAPPATNGACCGHDAPCDDPACDAHPRPELVLRGRPRRPAR